MQASPHARDHARDHTDADDRHGTMAPYDSSWATHEQTPSGILEAIMENQKERFERSKKLGRVQHRIHVFLEFGSVRKFLNIALLLDIILVVVNMILEIQYLESVKHDFEHHYLNDAVRVGGHYADDTEMNIHDFGDETLLDAILGLTCVSAVILGLFIVENVLHMASVGPFCYFTDPLMLLDITVVSLAFGFEVHEIELLHNKEDAGGSSAVGVLIFARVWRFAQFGHGVFLMQHGTEHGAEGKGGHADSDIGGLDSDTQPAGNHGDVSYAAAH
jgi:hypothetical protein